MDLFIYLFIYLFIFLLSGKLKNREKRLGEGCHFSSGSNTRIASGCNFCLRTN
jgi:hypothetical protein